MTKNALPLESAIHVFFYENWLNSILVTISLSQYVSLKRESFKNYNLFETIDSPREVTVCMLTAQWASIALSQMMSKDSFGCLETYRLRSINIKLPYTQLHSASLGTAQQLRSAQRVPPHRKSEVFYSCLTTASCGRLRLRQQGNMDGQTLETLADI
jgi:hypothetical protein